MLERFMWAGKRCFFDFQRCQLCPSSQTCDTRTSTHCDRGKRACVARRRKLQARDATCRSHRSDRATDRIEELSARPDTYKVEKIMNAYERQAGQT